MSLLQLSRWDSDRASYAKRRSSHNSTPKEEAQEKIQLLTLTIRILCCFLSLAILFHGCFLPLSVHLDAQSGASSLSRFQSAHARVQRISLLLLARSGGPIVQGTTSPSTISPSSAWSYFAHITKRSRIIFEVHRCAASLSS
jgi:hypothetical protein